jgi:hypothetical protein
MVTLSACKRGDDATNSYIGRWEERRDYYHEVDSTFTPPHIYTEDTTLAAGKGEIMELRSDGICTTLRRSGGLVDTVSYLVQGAEIVFFKPGGRSDTAQLTVSEKELTISKETHDSKTFTHLIGTFARL